MRAALIFSSTSHSINVQKVRSLPPASWQGLRARGGPLTAPCRRSSRSSSRKPSTSSARSPRSKTSANRYCFTSPAKGPPLHTTRTHPRPPKGEGKRAHRQPARPGNSISTQDRPIAPMMSRNAIYTAKRKCHPSSGISPTPLFYISPRLRRLGPEMPKDHTSPPFLARYHPSRVPDLLGRQEDIFIPFVPRRNGPGAAPLYDPIV